MGSVLLIVASEAGGTSIEGPIAVEKQQKLHGSVEIRTHISAGMVVAQWPVHMAVSCRCLGAGTVWQGMLDHTRLADKEGEGMPWTLARLSQSNAHFWIQVVL